MQRRLRRNGRDMFCACFVSDLVTSWVQGVPDAHELTLGPNLDESQSRHVALILNLQYYLNCAGAFDLSPVLSLAEVALFRLTVCPAGAENPHEVLVTEAGYEYRGIQFKSLSGIACKTPALTNSFSARRTNSSPRFRLSCRNPAAYDVGIGKARSTTWRTFTSAPRGRSCATTACVAASENLESSIASRTLIASLCCPDLRADPGPVWPCLRTTSTEHRA